jgi:hypothetical protein
VLQKKKNNFTQVSLPWQRTNINHYTRIGGTFAPPKIFNTNSIICDNISDLVKIFNKTLKSFCKMIEKMEKSSLTTLD